MADDNKTQPTTADVDAYLDTVIPPIRREDGRRVLALMREVTGETGTMWGPSIVGFGKYHYTYASGREGDWMRVGLSARKASLSLYGLKDSPEGAALLPSLGTYTEGAGCVYVKRVSDIDERVLARLVAIAYARTDYP
jgi:hypothetical protein